MEKKYLTISDLKNRWIYTKAGIHKLTKSKDFPKPFAIVSNEKIKIYDEEDIAKYEYGKIWLFDENAKVRRQKLFFLLNEAKNADENERKQILEYCFGNPD